MARIYESVVLTWPPTHKLPIWFDSDSGFWLRTPAGHLGHPDADQLRGQVSIHCPDEECDEPGFKLMAANGDVEQLIEVGEL